MSQIDSSEDSLTFEVPPLRLSFHWDGARFTHEVAVAGLTVAASVEWEAERDDPTRVVSPAYQQFHRQVAVEGEQALLVGQWGSHHFSAVFTVSADETGVMIEVDTAVRTRAEIQALASTYTVALSSNELLDAGPQAIEWSLGAPAAGRLRFEPGRPAVVGLAEAGRRQTRGQASAEIAPGMATQRLLYRWRWVRPSGLA